MKRTRWYRLSVFRGARFLTGILPRPLTQFLAGLLGRVTFALSPGLREILRDNLGVLTRGSSATLDRLCRANLTNFLRMLADYFYCSSAPPAVVHGLVRQREGRQRLLEARARGKGALLITAHLGNWEMGGMLLALDDVPITVVTLDEPSDELTKWRAEYRQRLGMRTIAIGSDPFAFLDIVNALRRNECVAMLVDRPYANSGTTVRLFGRETQFSTGPAVLWQHTGAAVVPAFVLRDTHGCYLSIIGEPVEMQAGVDAISKNTRRIAAVFEEMIREHRDQWFNFVPIWNGTPKNAVASFDANTIH
jgi:KDO2-lipid IV(A) lauroyltransferase